MPSKKQLDRNLIVKLIKNGATKKHIANVSNIAYMTLWRYLKNNPITEQEMQKVGEMQPRKKQIKKSENENKTDIGEI